MDTLTLNIILFIIILFFVRINYTFLVLIKASKLVDSYCSKLISKKEYDKSIDYFKEMQKGYFEYLFTFWLFGELKMIKPKYRKFFLNF